MAKISYSFSALIGLFSGDIRQYRSTLFRMIASALFLAAFVLFCCSSTTSPENEENVEILFPGVLPDTVGAGIIPLSISGPVTIGGNYAVLNGSPFRVIVFNNRDYNICYFSDTFSDGIFIINNLPKDSVDIVFFSSNHKSHKITDFYPDNDTIQINIQLSVYKREYPILVQDGLYIRFKDHIVDWPFGVDKKLKIDEVSMDNDVFTFLNAQKFYFIKKLSPNTTIETIKPFNLEWLLRIYFFSFKTLIDLNSLEYVGNAANLYQFVETVTTHSITPTLEEE
jgi:hypothetical protein